MKKISIILLMCIGILMVVITLKLNISNADSNRYVATDKSIFGEDALITNSEEDQSQKIENCIKKSATDNKELFIPAGKYYMNKAVTLKKSNTMVVGDKDNATILINKDNALNVIFDADNYIRTMKNIRFENLYFDGIEIKAREKTDITIENNVFYNANNDMMLSFLVGKNININHNIFLRDVEHGVIPKRLARVIYVGGYDWGDQYKFIENVTITDNLFGAKINELDAIKSLQKEENKRNIEKLQRVLKSGIINLKNEQNLITTSINSFCNLKNAIIENNVFYSNFDEQAPDKNPIEHDHATYLRGSQNIYISCNHMRGFQNGTGGGFKFKTGRDIAIVNNYIRNSSVILSILPEYGLTETIEEGETSQFTRLLVANNIFDFKEWQKTYAFGILPEWISSQTMPTKIDGNVFINNKYINYQNIHRDLRKGIQLLEINNPTNTYIKGNTRDDTLDKHLTHWKWTAEDEAKMPKDWRQMLSKEPRLEAYYNNKKDLQMPFLNMLATAVPTTIELGQEVSAENLVKNAYDKDNKKPTFIITNPEEIKTPGQKEVIVKVRYPDQIPEVNITVPVTVRDTKSPQIEIKKTEFERGDDIKITDVANITDLDKNLDIKSEPAINSMSVGKQSIKIIAMDSSRNKTEKQIEITIKKSKLQEAIEDLFDKQGKIKLNVKIDKINDLENQVKQVKNEALKNEFTQLLEEAKRQLKNNQEAKINVTINKHWDDNSNINGKRPSSIKYVLKGGVGSLEQTVSGNATTDDNWSYTFTNLAKYNGQGNEIQYLVEEQEVSADGLKFYTNQISGNYKTGINIVNTYTVPDNKIEVRVNKYWEDNSNVNQKRPASIKYVLKGGATLLEQIVSGNLRTDENWSYKFTNLAKYNAQGNEIQYIVEEQEENPDDLKFYTNQVSGNYKIGINIVNTYTVPDNKVEVRVNKHWDDNSNAGQKRPTSIKYILKGGATPIEQIISGNLRTDENWSYTFTNLVKYNGQGNEIKYLVEEQEVSVDGLKFYTNQISGNYKTGVNIVNTYTVPDNKIEVTVNKHWDDDSNASQKRPSSIKYVLNGGSTPIEQIVSGNTKTDENWNYTFTNLAKYNTQGNEIVYTVEEQETSVDELKFYTKQVSGNYKNGFNVTNIFKVFDEKISVTITNNWEDNNNQNGKRPRRIKYILKGGIKDIEHIIEEADKTNNWSYTFTNLPKYNGQGNEIQYTLEEQEENSDDLKFYTKQIYGDYKNGFNIKHQYKEPKNDNEKPNENQNKVNDDKEKPNENQNKVNDDKEKPNQNQNKINDDKGKSNQNQNIINKDNKPNNNFDNTAKGKLPQTGDKNTIIIVSVLIVLGVVIFIKFRSNKNN